MVTDQKTPFWTNRPNWQKKGELGFTVSFSYTCGIIINAKTKLMVILPKEAVEKSVSSSNVFPSTALNFNTTSLKKMPMTKPKYKMICLAADKIICLLLIAKISLFISVRNIDFYFFITMFKPSNFHYFEGANSARID